MPNQRSKDQMLIALALDQRLLKELDDARRVSNETRSGFIRAAIGKALADLGYKDAEGYIRAPDRAGRPRKQVSSSREDLEKSKIEASIAACSNIPPVAAGPAQANAPGSRSSRSRNRK